MKNNEEKSGTGRVLKAVSWGALYRGATTVLPFVTRTLIIYILGVEYLGLNSLFSSVLSFLSLTELGIGSALIYSMYEPMANHNYQKVSALLNLYRKAYFVIGLTILFVGMAVVPFMKYLIKGDIPQDVNAEIIYLIYLSNTAISYFFAAYKKSVFYASQRVDIVNISSFLATLVQYIGQIVVLIAIKSYYIYLIFMVIGTVFDNIYTYLYFQKHFSHCRAGGLIEKKEKRSIAINVSALFISKIGGIIRSSADSIVISAFLGIVLVGLYNNYFYIISVAMMIFSVVMEALKPTVAKRTLTQDKSETLKDFYMLNYLYVWLVTVVTGVFLASCQDFMMIWVGESNMLDDGIPILLAIYLYTHKFCDILAVYQDATGKWYYTRVIPLVAAIVNLGLNLLLVNYIGLYGVILSTIVSIVFIYDIAYSVKLFKHMLDNEKGYKKYYRTQILLSIVAFFSISTTYWVCGNINISNNAVRFITKLITSLLIVSIISYLLYSRFSIYKDAKRFVLVHVFRK